MGYLWCFRFQVLMYLRARSILFGLLNDVKRKKMYFFQHLQIGDYPHENPRWSNAHLLIARWLMGSSVHMAPSRQPHLVMQPMRSQQVSGFGFTALGEPQTLIA